MTKHVLVLCQRKTGTLPNGGDVETDIVPDINKIVEYLLGSDTTVEYMTSGLENLDGTPNGTADYMFSLASWDPRATEFISTHLEYYSLIIMNTCPILGFEYNLAHQLLKPDGLLLVSILPILEPDSSFEVYLRESLAKYQHLFEYIEDSLSLFKKVQSGGKRKKQTRNRKRNKRKTKTLHRKWRK